MSPAFLCLVVKSVVKSELRAFSHTHIHMKATEQYFPVVLFVMLYKVVLTFESVG